MGAWCGVGWANGALCVCVMGMMCVCARVALGRVSRVTRCGEQKKSDGGTGPRERAPSAQVLCAGQSQTRSRLAVPGLVGRESAGLRSGKERRSRPWAQRLRMCGTERERGADACKQESACEARRYYEV